MDENKRMVQIDTLDTNADARIELLDLIAEARSMSEQGNFAFSSLHQQDFFAKVDKILTPYVEPAPELAPVESGETGETP